MKIQYCFILLFCLFLSCKKEDGTVTPKVNTFTCKVNGVDVISSIENVKIIPGNQGLIIIRGKTPGNSFELVQITIDPNSIGEIDFENNITGEYYIDSSRKLYNTSFGGQGKIKITKNDTEAIEGSFHFTATQNIDPSSQVNVTEGKFYVHR